MYENNDYSDWVRKNEEFEVIEDRKDWLLVKNEKKEGLVPANHAAYVQNNNKYLFKDYYHPDISSNKLEEYLGWAPEASFLISDADASEFPVQVGQLRNPTTLTSI